MLLASEFWQPYLNSDQERFRVLIKRDSFVDPDRQNREIPFKIYHPVDHGTKKLPVIIWSHGLGGSREGAAFLSRFLSSYGYIVIHPQHVGTDSSLWEGKPGHPWDAIRATLIPRKATLNRYRDIPFVLDHIEEWAAEHEEIGPYLDMERIGISGHSFGANTTQIMAGQWIGRGNRMYQLQEKRFKAGILYSPIPANNRDEGYENVYGGIDIPLFHMTGTKDESPLEGFGYEQRLEIFEHCGAPDQHVLTLENGDHMVFAGSRGKLEPNPEQTIHETIIKMAALAFWDIYLKDDSHAHNWLTGGTFGGWVRGAAEYQYKP